MPLNVALRAPLDIPHIHFEIIVNLTNQMGPYFVIASNETDTTKPGDTERCLVLWNMCALCCGIWDVGTEQ